MYPAYIFLDLSQVSTKDSLTGDYEKASQGPEQLDTSENGASNPPFNATGRLLSCNVSQLCYLFTVFMWIFYILRHSIVYM